MEETVLVTGGTRGLGRAVVECLLKEGRSVAFTWSSRERLARELEEKSEGKARAWSLDLERRQRPAQLVTEIERQQGPVVGLVNNAGVEHSEPLAFTADEDWDRILEINLGGAFRCCRAVLKGMVTRRRGGIVNLASLSALRGVPGHTAYAAAKAGLIGLSRCLAREVGRRGVRVNVVVPGYVATEMTKDLPGPVVDRLRAGEVLPHGVEGTDVAELVAFLLSDRARSITGQTFVIDAGVSS